MGAAALAEYRAAYAYYGRAFGYRRFKIGRHAHGQRVEAELRAQLFVKLLHLREIPDGARCGYRHEPAQAQARQTRDRRRELESELGRIAPAELLLATTLVEKQPQLADQVATNYLKADITPRQKAMLGFAMKVCNDAANIVESDFEALRAHGFDDEDIWDIGAITALFGLSNRMANLMSLRPNEDFYLMGRVPREKKA